MSRMSVLFTELTEMGEYAIGRDDARRGVRRATVNMKPKAREAYDLGYRQYQNEQRSRG